jgi:hypothetical protein
LLGQNHTHGADAGSAVIQVRHHMVLVDQQRGALQASICGVVLLDRPYHDLGQFSENKALKVAKTNPEVHKSKNIGAE